jgi:hypothetical protein
MGGERNVLGRSAKSKDIGGAALDATHCDGIGRGEKESTKGVKKRNRCCEAKREVDVGARELSGTLF